MAVVLIRCDASPEIGVGHFMRCSALAATLRERGHMVYFAMRQITPLVATRLRELGFHRLVLPETATILDELPRLRDGIGHLGADCVLVDHYQATSEYFAGLASFNVTLAVVDDLADRDLTAVYWLLNQNAGADQLSYQVNADCVRLLGPGWCLLRASFAQARQQLQRTFSDKDHRLLITLGGGTCTELAGTIVQALHHGTIPLHIRLVLAEGSTPVNSSRHQIEILHNVANMAELMAWADLSINAGGSTCWELCCLGVPMLVLILSRDQKGVAEVLQREGCAQHIQKDDLYSERLARIVEWMLKSPQGRQAMSQQGQRLVDGLGACRAAQVLEQTIARWKGLSP